MPTSLYLALGALVAWLLGRWLERCAARQAEEVRDEEGQC